MNEENLNIVNKNYNNMVKPKFEEYLLFALTGAIILKLFDIYIYNFSKWYITPIIGIILGILYVKFQNNIKKTIKKTLR